MPELPRISGDSAIKAFQIEPPDLTPRPRGHGLHGEIFPIDYLSLDRYYLIHDSDKRPA